MDRRRLLGLAAGLMLVVPVSPVLAAESGGSGHRLVLQVDTNDALAMNLALNNATAAKEFYSSRHEPIAIEIVAYGPGLHMLRADTSPIKARLAAFHRSMPDVRLSACNNTLQGMETAEGKKVDLMPEATIVPSGVVRLMELQEQGWSYVRP
ncbi:MAG TPA: DsrE family protein [Stellaceae bacterium]|nr:DsrE family protein [Stellaceae bacterium]